MPDPLARLTSLEGVSSAFAATRDGIDALLRDRGLRRTTPEQTAESLLRGAHASASLQPDPDPDAATEAAVRMSTELLALVPVVQRSPLQALARLDVLAGGTGRPTTGAPRIAGLPRLLTEPTTAPGLLVAALAHAEIATVAPFGGTDGLVARAVERLLLVARGVDPASLLVPEAGHLALRAEYESNLRAYASGTVSGAHAWLLYAAEAQARAAEESPLRG